MDAPGHGNKRFMGNWLPFEVDRLEISLCPSKSNEDQTEIRKGSLSVAEEVT